MERAEKKAEPERNKMIREQHGTQMLLIIFHSRRHFRIHPISRSSAHCANLQDKLCMLSTLCKIITHSVRATPPSSLSLSLSVKSCPNISPTVDLALLLYSLLLLVPLYLFSSILISRLLAVGMYLAFAFPFIALIT